LLLEIENKKTAIREGWLSLIDLAYVCATLRSIRRQNKNVPTFSWKWASDDGYAVTQTDQTYWAQFYYRMEMSQGLEQGNFPLNDAHLLYY